MRIKLNRWRRKLAVTILEACIVLMLTGCLVAIGGCCIIKLCRKLDAQHHEPPEPGDWSTWIDWQVVPCDCAPTGAVTCSLQWSSNLTSWQTVATLTYTGMPVNVRCASNFPGIGFLRVTLP